MLCRYYVKLPDVTNLQINVMKIDSSPRTTPVAGTTSAPARGPKSAPQKSPGMGGQDNVTISSTSSQIQAIDSGLAEASGFDTAKVEAIKQAISEGRFSIHPELIADKLIASAKELVLQQPRG